MAIILIDFDNTITAFDSYPDIAPIRDHAEEVINKYYDLGHCIIINTCRCDDALDMAKLWLKEHGIKYCHVNENCPIRVAMFGNDTRKVGGHINIDDKNLESLFYGCIDWIRVDKYLDVVITTTKFNHNLCENRNNILQSK